MKCLIINGGPRKGNTYALAEIVRKQMKARGEVFFTEIHLGRVEIPFCLGCFNCFINGEGRCPHHEYIAGITRAIEECDCLIVLSPAYSLAPTALIKNLIDHFSYQFHRPRYYDKKALVITTTAGAGARPSAKYIRDVLKHWGIGRAYAYSLICRSAGGYKPTPKVEKKLKSLADRLYDDVAGGSVHSPTYKRVFYYNIWRAFVGKDRDGYDYRYWKEHDMLDSVYFKPVGTGPFKKLFGKAVYGLMNRVV